MTDRLFADILIFVLLIPFAVVGGGLTAGVSSCQLSKQLGRSNVTVWDKARGAGGRMSTSRSNGNPECKVDLGAQYISATKAYREKHK